MRGLSCLLKSKILALSSLVIEEAALLLYFSKEAAFYLLKENKRLKSINDVYEYIKSNVPNGIPLAQYYYQCRELRNMLCHPNSHKERLSIIPMMADDYYDTYSALVELYRYLIAGIPIENS